MGLLDLISINLLSLSLFDSILSKKDIDKALEFFGECFVFFSVIKVQFAPLLLFAEYIPRIILFL